VQIKHARNGREYSLPELTHFIVDSYCPENKTVYEIFWCFSHMHHCQPFRDIITTNSDTLPARYEQTMSQLEQKSRVEYQVKVRWECDFDDDGIETPELLGHPTVSQSSVYKGRFVTGQDGGHDSSLQGVGRRDYPVSGWKEPLLLQL